MTFADLTILEEAVQDATATDYECVALAGLDGLVGNWVYNAFGIERPTSELAALAAQRGAPIARLLVVVDDPMSKEAADRIRASLKWRDVPPF